MSKLDYLTIAIVGACILAIIFLIYKMTDLFKGDKPLDKIEIAADSIETDADSIYDYDIDNVVDSAATKANSSTDNAVTTTPATSTPATTKELDAASSGAEDDVNSKTYGGNYTHPGGDFMVIAGAFTQKSLARQEVNRLKKKGYSTAGMEIFDRGKYAVVLVDQFNNMAAAERLVKKLESEGIKCYVKMKEPS
ncbi:MAG: SPOR domain-containing protein [Saprospiraceae bacterium]